jgi:hypothetical protein
MSQTPDIKLASELIAAAEHELGTLTPGQRRDLLADRFPFYSSADIRMIVEAVGWSFTDTGDAYDACQCNEDIKTGDTLVIREADYAGHCVGRDEDGFRIFEGDGGVRDIVVVGLAWAWPIAVTVEAGNLHGIEEDTGAYARVIADAGFTRTQVQAAVDQATRLGAPVRPLFLAWLGAQA